MHFRENTSCFSLKWNKDWWDLGHAQFDGEALLVFTTRNCFCFCGYLLFVTVAIVCWLQTREGSMLMICYYNIFIFPNLMDGT